MEDVKPASTVAGDTANSNSLSLEEQVTLQLAQKLSATEPSLPGKWGRGKGRGTGKGGKPSRKNRGGEQNRHGRPNGCVRSFRIPAFDGWEASPY